MASMGIPQQIKADDAPDTSLIKCKTTCYTIKYIIDIPHNPTEQAVVERSNHSLKEMLNKYKGVSKTPKDRLHKGLLRFYF